LRRSRRFSVKKSFEFRRSESPLSVSGFHTRSLAKPEARKGGFPGGTQKQYGKSKGEVLRGEKKMWGLNPLYSFEMLFTVNEVNKGVKKMTTYSTGIEKFAVLGGSKRTIRATGEDGLGDADIMSEFYQAKQFQNLIVTRAVDPVSAVFRRIYDQQLRFEFNFTVKSLAPESRFRHLQLVTKKARITRPPSNYDGGDTLNIKYSDPQVFYWQASDAVLVKEKL
jgi:hypothetical protein